MKLGKNNKDKNKDKKKKGIVGRMIKIFTFLSTLPFIFNMLMILISIALLFVAAAGILQFFHEDDPIVNEYEIDWGNYTCSCTFLTAEQILQVQAGNQVEVDLTNGGSLNITGGSVVSANGLVIPSMGSLKSGVGQYGIPIWSGYSKADTGTDIVVGLSIDTRTETKMSTSTKDTYESVVVNEYMAQGPTSRMLSGDLEMEDGRLCVALASGVIAWPDDPDHSSSMIGLDVDIVLKNGEVIPCRVKDAKANVHTGELHVLHCGGWGRKNNKYEVDSNGNPKWYKGDKSVIELYRAPSNSVASWLASYIKSVGGYDHAKIYNHGRGVDVAKTINPYSFDSTTLVSSLSLSTSNSSTTSSFATTGTGVTQTNTSVSSSTLSSSNIDVSNFNLTDAKGFVIVEGTGGSSCVVSAYKKNGSTWEKFVDTNGVLGENGMSNNKTEGDKTTPIGIWKMNTPFGQKEALDGFPSSYLKVSESSDGTDMPDYWSGSTGNESYGYNKLKLNFDTTIASDFIGERISSSGYSGYYNYVIDSGYNYNGAYKAGSALFLHCNANGATSTSGCVAIPESEMIKILKEYEDDCWYIAQAPKGYISQLYNAYGVNNGLSPDGDFGTGSTTTSSSTTSSFENTTGVTVNSNTLTYTNGQKISLDSSWEYASESAIYSGSATYYTATTNRNNICVAVNAGHGCTGGSSKKTKTHPDGTGKYMGGTTEKGALTSVAISSGMDFADGTSEASVNLKVAKYMKDELLSMGYDVLMIRETDDEQLDNIARTVIANNVADCHVAIHFDSSSSNIGAYYVRVPDVDAYKNMEPVKTWWQKHDELGEALLIGLSNNGSSIRGTNGDGIDLSQTSYSTIPSADIELGDKLTPHGDADCEKFAKGLALGIDEFYKTNTPVNQSKRVGSVLSNSSSSSTSTSISNTVVAGIVNKNKNNLRTECSMATEGICGCYVSDPNCMCHIFGGSDGVLGTSDDNTEAIQEEIQSNNSSDYTGNAAVVDSTAKKIMQDMYLGLDDAYKNGYSDIYCCKTDGKGKVKVCGHSKCNSNFTITKIDGTTVNKTTRTDCSAYVGMVLTALGADWSGLGYGTGEMMTWASKVQASDKFIWLGYTPDIVQPGDIVIKSGHTEIFMGWADRNANKVYKYSWGSSANVYNIMPDKSTGAVDAKNAVQGYDTYAYKYIIRYVGSGGYGK